MLMSAGLIGVWYADLHSRQLRELPVFAKAARNTAMLYDGLVVPWRPSAPRLGHVVDRDGVWGMGVPRDAMALRHGRALRVPVHRNETRSPGCISCAFVGSHERRSSSGTCRPVSSKPGAGTYRPLRVPRYADPLCDRDARHDAAKHGLFVTGLALALVAAAILTLVIPRLYPFKLGLGRR
jgi:hypothetical protein